MSVSCEPALGLYHGGVTDSQPTSTGSCDLVFRSVLALIVSAVRVCLVIDGLDEYGGSDRDISWFVTQFNPFTFPLILVNCAALCSYVDRNRSSIARLI